MGTNLIIKLFKKYVFLYNNRIVKFVNIVVKAIIFILTYLIIRAK